MSATTALHTPLARPTKTANTSLALQRKCACGGSAGLSGKCEECSEKRLGFQRKLMIGPSNDPLELEADRVADQVMSMPAREGVGTVPPLIQRGSAQSSGQIDAAPASVEKVLASSGRPLDQKSQQDMGQRFGHDFSAVRIHSDSSAAESASDASAHAYTVGRDVVFAAGQYSPETPQGQRLLAHELTHVLQQSAGAAGSFAPIAAPVSRTLRRAPDPGPFAGMDIKELRKRAPTDKAAAEEMWRRFDAMSNQDLERYARSDPMAQSIYEQRKVPPRAGVGQGRFSTPTIEGPLTEDLVKARAQGPTRTTKSPVSPGVETEGGTMGVARTDIPGLENRAFIGKSPKAGGAFNPNSLFSPPTDPKVLPQTHAHAEQIISDQLHSALKSIPREQLKGRTVWMLIEQEPCSTCAQGTGGNAQVEAGVLKKLSDAYPELRFEVKNLNTSGRLVIEARPGVASTLPPALPKAGLSNQTPSINKAPPEVTGEPPPSPKMAPTPKVPLQEPPGATGTPEVPAGSAPKVQENPLPKVPEIEGPRVPAIGAPKVPEIEGPKVPAIGAPKVPEIEGPKVPAIGAPKVPEIEVPVPRPGSARTGLGGRLGRGAAGAGAAVLESAVGLALGLAMVVGYLIIELIIIPRLLEWQRQLEESRRKYLQKQIQDYFVKFVSDSVISKVRDRYLWDLQQFEATGKTAYVNVTLLVRLEDTSNRFQLFSETMPDSIFDVEFYDASLSSASLSDNPVETKAGQTTRCKDCGAFGRDKTFMSNNPLWEQPITFSFVSPSSQQLLQEYPLRPGEDIKKQSSCFIATACFGSALAPQVLTLREFRDRRLMVNCAGRTFVRGYYAFSPPVAAWLERHAFARAVVREGLIRPVAALVQWTRCI